MQKFTLLYVLTTGSISPAIPESFVTYMKSDNFGPYLFSKSYLYLVVEIKILSVIGLIQLNQETDRALSIEAFLLKSGVFAVV